MHAGLVEATHTTHISNTCQKSVYHPVVVYRARTWSTKHPDELGRASAIVAYWDYIAQRTLFVFPHRLEDVDEVICSAAAGKNNDSFGLEVAVAHLHGCRCAAIER